MARTEVFDSRPPHRSPRPAGRTLANVIVVFTGLALFAVATWTGSVLGPVESGEDRRSVLPWLMHGLGGLLAVGAVMVAQRRRTGRLGQVMLAIAGVMPIVALVAFRYTGPWAWFGFILPAVLLLGSVPFLGPMPPPDRGTRER